MVTGRAWHHLGLYILMLVAHAEPFLSFGAKSHGLGLPGAVVTYTWAGQAAGCRVGTWSSLMAQKVVITHIVWSPETGRFRK